jgi:hypothetical protein
MKNLARPCVIRKQEHLLESEAFSIIATLRPPLDGYAIFIPHVGTVKSLMKLLAAAPKVSLANILFFNM